MAVADAEANPHVVRGDDERFTGYGVMGVPFSSGHYLVLRDMLATSLGTAYRAIWHRDPAGRWTIYTTADPNVSCPRYFGSATAVEQVSAIDVSWRDEWRLDVTMGSRLAWQCLLRPRIRPVFPSRRTPILLAVAPSAARLRAASIRSWRSTSVMRRERT